MKRYHGVYSMEKVEQEIRADRELNLRGEICPYTFVKSKLAMEEMRPGQVLRVIVDHEPATRNVPRSMENEGNEVLAVGKVNEAEWQIVVRKHG
jgi:TusA-related sulfurtransferase